MIMVYKNKPVQKFDCAEPSVSIEFFLNKNLKKRLQYSLSFTVQRNNVANYCRSSVFPPVFIGDWLWYQWWGVLYWIFIPLRQDPHCILKGLHWGFFDMTGLEIIFRDECSIWCKSWPKACLRNFRSFDHYIFSKIIILHVIMKKVTKNCKALKRFSFKLDKE
jgi:hypothetical protein